MATGGATRPVRDDWTCTIRRAADGSPGYVAEPLFPGTVIPVCTPNLAKSLRSPADLRRATLIRVSNMPDDWPLWFEAAGLRRRAHAGGELSFESNTMAMQAALNGAGVAIAQLPYVSDALAAGQLVAPLPITAQTQESWFLMYRPARRDEAALQAFRDWLHGEAERQNKVDAALLKGPKKKSAARASA